jgi:transketolase
MHNPKFSKLRCKIYRKKILEISKKVSALHIGGSFSSVEILDVIYNDLLKKNDKFILSKGHAGILQYVVLNYKGVIKDKVLNSYLTKNGILGVHPDYGNPGIEASTGSLGHGLAISAGMALAKKKSNFFVVMSDGELQEGSVWEAALLISSINLKNIIIIIDSNGYQSSSKTFDTHPTLYPIKKKFEYFGWEATECNGHNSLEIYKKIKKRSKEKPFALIANTKKGFPVKFMIKDPKWHYRSPNDAEYIQALKEIDKL